MFNQYIIILNKYIVESIKYKYLFNHNILEINKEKSNLKIKILKRYTVTVYLF